MPNSRFASLFMPPGVLPDASLLFSARGLRAFGDGYVSLLLPYYLKLLGYSAFEIGTIIAATLLGSGLMTLAVGFLAHHFRQRSLLKTAAWMMMATGVIFVLTTDFWPLLLIAAVGTINPSGGEAGMAAPLEHTLLTRTVSAEHRTALFARYSLIYSLLGALGAQAAALPVLGQQWFALDAIQAVQFMFIFYSVLGLGCLVLYRRLSPEIEPHDSAPSIPLDKSRRVVYTLAAVFSLDAFGGGFAVQSLLALWLFDHFQLSIVTAGTIFFWSGILSAFSLIAAAPLARRIGLINSIVFSQLFSGVCLILIPLMPNLSLALLCIMLRSVVQRLDVPARSSYVMAVVAPSERPAAASVTIVPRGIASAASPMLAGWLFTLSPFGWPLVVGGVLKIIYTVLLLAVFRRVRPPEETRNS